jgi:Yip1 domain
MNGTESALQAACAIHPERQALQICTRCGNFACEECLSGSPPGETLCAACVAREGVSRLPWDDRHELGLFRAFFRSVGAIMLSPRKTFSTTRFSGDLGESLLFAGIANFFGYFPTFALFALIGVFMPEPANANPSPIPLRLVVMGTYGVMALGSPFLGVAVTTLIAVLDHVVLRALGKPRPLETTIRAAALAQAPMVIGLLPFCSLYITPFWGLVAKVFAYRGMHRTTTGVAVGGAILVPVILSVAFCGFYAILFAIFAAAAGVKT